ncbi:hypothetical protein [Streptomyces sp. AC555_RSS877]|uniref:hypothetical protein n=1 Tax=Streptomyces sp. AC555_RSS877 TaxID=2823688 RepID=UPI001C269627|nr:hypothetical protein [Streptomyces sp. AC555_RSS877]
MQGGFSERRLISEVIAIHRFEPDLFALYVEGRTDKVFFDYLTGEARVHVYEIDSVHVPADIVAAAGVDNGAKGRVIALASALENEIPEIDLPVRCIVDTDSDKVLDNKREGAKYLRYTDYSCVESYAWNEATLTKYLSVGLHDTLGLTARAVMDTLEPVLQELFFMRATNSASGKNLAWVSASACVSYKRKRFTFDREDLWRRWLQANSCWPDREVLQHKAEDLKDRSADFPAADLLQGHDLVELLSLLVRETVKPPALGNQEVVSRMLLLSVDRQQAAHFALLRELISLSDRYTDPA